MNGGDAAGMLLLPFLIPFVLWAAAPAAWHPAISRVFLVLVVLNGIALLAVTLRGVGRVGAWRWQRGVAATAYAAALQRHLGTGAWHVERATQVDAGRLLLVVRRERHRIALLCRRPGLDAAASEAAALRASGCETRLLVVERPGRAGEHGYTVLKDLDPTTIPAIGGVSTIP